MTDPNVVALLELLTKHTFRGSISPERDAAVRLMALLAAAEKPAEAAPVAPLPWVVRRRDDKTVVATFLNVVYAGDYHRVILGDSDTFEVAAAPPIAAVGFNEFGVARGDGWTADYDHSDATRTLRVYIGLRPREDAGETLAKALAAVGRTA